MDQLARDFADQAAFVFIYIREAHPDDFPDYAAHRSFEQKWKHAVDLRERHKTPRTIAVDDLDGSVHRLYGGRLNTCWIVNDAGRVSYKAEWTSEPHVRKALEDTLRVSELTRQGGFKDFYQESMTVIEGGRPPSKRELARS